MKSIRIEATNNTPFIEFNDSGNFSIRGKSIPENGYEFYKPVFDWITDFMEEPIKKSVLDIELEYFNTSTSKCILNIFKGLEKVKSKGHDITVRWHYNNEDEDMLEAGKDYMSIVKLEFSFIAS